MAGEQAAPAMTRRHKPPTVPAAPEAGRVRVALVSGSGPGAASEIQTLLRKRLRIGALVCVAAFAVCLPMEFFNYERTPALVWFHLIPYTAILALVAPLAVVLWSKQQLSLRRLRAIELMGGGVATAGFLWTHFHSVRFWLPIYAARGPIEVGILAVFASHIWFVLIVTYGLLVPNTWFRCAAFVGVLAFIPLATGAAIGLTDSAIDGRLLGHFLLLTGVLMAVAVALAVFGSHHIQVLRQQAFEARKLGQYQLRHRLGAGGMGEVYLAEHLLLRRPCAVKVIRPERAGDARELQRFEREVQTMATLTHPNTVQIFDYGHADDGTFYYAMEYLPGLTLGELVRRHGPLPPERAIHFLRQVCGALSEAHAVGLIHRDIKPGTIMVCQRGGLHDVAKLLDFGLVRAPLASTGEQHLTQEGAVLGTPAYMSPEQAAGRGDLDARSDIYSLGAVGYFLLTGQPPFLKPSGTETIAAHLYESPRQITQHRIDVPAELDAVILKCLAKEADGRYPDATRLDQALAACPAAARWTQDLAAEWWQRREGAVARM
jgi:serine/threonine-protein kinase